MVRHACESPVFSAAVLRFALLFSALSVAPSCKHEKAKAEGAYAHRPKLSPLKASSWLIDLEVAGFGKAAVAVPLGANAPRPIVIALHGSADRPEWACASLRSIAGPTPFVLCPRGVARADFTASDARYTFGRLDDTEAELRLALAALKERFGVYVAAGPVIFSGFEIGADHAASIAAQEPSFFSRLLLIEPPSPTSWPSSRAAMFGRTGGQRVLFAFGPRYRDELEQRAVLTSRSGAEARAVFLGDAPVTLEPPTRRLLGRNWDWLTARALAASAPENLAGNPLPAGQPKAPKPIDL